MSFPNDAGEAKPVKAGDFPGGPLKLTHGKPMGALGTHRGSVEARLRKAFFLTFNASPDFRPVLVESFRRNPQINNDNLRDY